MISVQTSYADRVHLEEGVLARVLLVSSNILFAETISISIQKTNCVTLIPVSPEAAPETIRTCRPDLVLLDEDCLAAEAGGLIWQAARDLPGLRVVLLNLQSNDIVVLDSHHATIHCLNDLFDVIQTKTPLEFVTRQ